MGDVASDSRLIAGRYWLEGVIGRGASATVYRAEDQRLHRRVAVKLFHYDPGETERHRAEIEVLTGLHHHGIVDLLDAGWTGEAMSTNTNYLGIAFEPGTTLRQRIAKRMLPAHAFAEIGYDLPEALDYIHSRGIVHRA